ncbi:MAG: helix-turn-helix domain-containing protein [Lachnospiraceae bacterium]|nr:helix-turn-helix domain-containing protein [Lachnospiraceae bacterium]
MGLLEEVDEEMRAAAHKQMEQEAAAAVILKWAGTFVASCSAWIFRILAMVFFLTAVLSGLMGLEDWPAGLACSWKDAGGSICCFPDSVCRGDNRGGDGACQQHIGWIYYVVKEERIVTVGQRIKYFRKRKGMTQRQLAVAAGLPEHNADVRITQYESGRRTAREALKKHWPRL